MHHTPVNPVPTMADEGRHPLSCGGHGRDIRIIRVQSRICVGGPAYVLKTLCLQMAPLGYHSILVGGALDVGEVSLENEFRGLGIDVRIIPEMGRAIRPLDDLRAIWRFFCLIRSVRPDIVDTHTAKAGFVARIAAVLAGVPVITHTFHGHVFKGYFSRWKTLAFLLAERGISRVTSCVIATTPMGKHDLGQVYRVAPNARIETILYGIDRQRFEQAPLRFGGQLRAELGLPGTVKLVALVARLVPVKNHSLWFRAIALLPEELRRNCRFLVVGDGELRSQLEQEVASLGLSGQVLFLGTRQDTERIYADLDLLVLTSKNEGTGIVLIEAMYAAVPVICTDVGAVRNALPQGYPYLVRPEDPVALAAAMQELLEDDDRRVGFGAGLPATVGNKWDVRRYARQHAELYCRLLKRSSPQRYRLIHRAEPVRQHNSVRQAGTLRHTRMALIAYMDYSVGADGAGRCAEWWMDRFLDELARHVSAIDYIGPCPDDRTGQRGRIRYLPLPVFSNEADFLAKIPTYLKRLSHYLQTCHLVQCRLPSHVSVLAWCVARCLGKPTFLYVGGDWGRAVRFRWLAAGAVKRLLAKPYTGLLTCLTETAMRACPTFVAGRELFNRYRHFSSSVFLYRSASHRLVDVTTLGPDQLDDQVFPERPVLYLGRIAAEKGLEPLLRAVAILRDRQENTPLTIAGQGYHLPAIQSLCRALALEDLVSFRGFINDKEQIGQLYRTHVATVVPSLTEGSPKVVLEAMSCGACVVASRTGGIPDVVTDESNGLLVPPGDPTALAEAISRIRQDRHLRMRIRHRALATARQISLDKEVARMMQLVEGLFCPQLGSTAGSDGGHHGKDQTFPPFPSRL